MNFLHSVEKHLEKLRKHVPYFLLASWKPLTKRAGSWSGVDLVESGSDPYQNVTDPQHWESAMDSQ